MIRHNISEADLTAAIDAASPNWRSRADEARKSARHERQFIQGMLDWGEIKSVYMSLQFEKCAYCERKLSTFRIEHDVEHYRPKNSVKMWPADRSVLRYRFLTGRASAKGYYWLAYDYWNYATACKACNTTLKSNYFPVPGARGKPFQSIDALRSECPFLIYPLSDKDADPETLIVFRGLTAVPLFKSGHRHRRAQVTIDFFRLNVRETLLFERAMIIDHLGLALEREDNELVQALCSQRMPHTSCSRSFRELWTTENEFARSCWASARQTFLG